MQGRKKLVGIMVLLVLVALVPLLLAHYVFNHMGELHIKKINHGTFVKNTSVSDFHVITKAKGDKPLSHWSGRWLLVYDSQGRCCNKQCRLEMHQLHQVRVASHNGIERSVVALLLPKHCPTPSLERSDKIWRLNSAQLSVWKKRLPSKKPQVLIIDPNAWVVMKYPDNARPKSVYEDMRILLHVSQVG